MLSAPMVVGYKGEIGRFLLAGLLEHLPKANDIHCVDVSNPPEDVIERLAKADTVFLCVPIQETAGWLKRYGSHLEGKTVAEQTSVKGFLYENANFDSLRFLSMHLLFRPSATPSSERRGLIFSDRIPREEVARYATELQSALKTPMAVLQSNGEPAHWVHDRLMARQQALVHRILLTLAEFVSEETATTYVGKRVIELADRIRSGDPDLYRLIQENPHLPRELEEFERRLGR